MVKKIVLFTLFTCTVYAGWYYKNSSMVPKTPDGLLEANYPKLNMEKPLFKHNNKDFRTLRPEITEYLIQRSKKSGVSPSLALSLLYQESEGKTWAKSPVGALGLMQIMPKAHYKGPASDLKKNPYLNIRLGIQYLKLCLRVTKSEWQAIQAYNTGHGNWLKGKRSPKHARHVMKIRKEIIAQLAKN